MVLCVGTRLGPYEILALIDAGGTGEVHRARDTQLKPEVALKVLPDSFASDPSPTPITVALKWTAGLKR